MASAIIKQDASIDDDDADGAQEFHLILRRPNICRVAPKLFAA